MFTKVQGSGKLLLIGCGNCKLGEMLPKHPAWKAVDLYHFVLDNARQGKIPVFKFTGLTFDQHEYLREHITLGKIIVEKEVE
jgi:transcription elongation factor Elf1